MIHVIAIITAKPGMRDAILREFRANMPAVHAEKGCIEYGPAIDTPDFGKIQTPFGADTFVVIEKWESADAPEGPRRGPAHGGLCGQDQGHDRQPRHPRAVAGLSALQRPANFGVRLVRKASRPSWKSALP